MEKRRVTEKQGVKIFQLNGTEGYDPPPVPVTCVAADDRFVVVGLASGQVRLYMALATDGAIRVQLVREVQVGPSGKPVQHVELASRDSLALVQSEGRVDVLSAATLERLGTLPLSGQPALAFCVDRSKASSQPHTRVAVAVRGKIRLFKWEESTSSMEFLHEVGVNPASAVLALGWVGPRVVVATRAAYQLVSLRNGEVEASLASPSSMPLVRVFRGQLMLQVDGGLATVRSTNGAVVQSNVRWAGVSPNAVAHSYPFVLGCGGDGVEVHLLCSEPVASHLQTVPIPGGGLLAACELGGSRVLLLTLGALYVLAPVPMRSQVRSLLKHGRLAEANALFAVQARKAESLSPAVAAERRKEFLHESGRALLKSAAFKEAFLEYTKADADPRELVACLPGWLPSSVPFEGKRLVIPRLIARQAALLDPENPTLKAEKLERSFRLQLLDYLEQYRLRHRSSDPSVAVAVDTTLVKLYASFSQADGEQVARFLRAEAATVHLDADDVRKWLLSQGYGAALVHVLRHLGEEEEALLRCKELPEAASAVPLMAELLTGVVSETLVFEHVDWLGQRAPERLLDVFAGPAARKRMLPPDRVLLTLRKHEASAKIPLVEPFLSTLCDEWGAGDEAHHTEWIRRRLGSARSEGGDVPRRRLLEALRKSKKYNVDIIRGELEKGPDVGSPLLRAALAYVLGRKGEHSRALAILVEELGLLGEAEEYCASLQDAAAFGELLRLQLKHHGVLPGVELLPDSIRLLLVRYAAYLPAEKVLPLLPESLRLGSVAPYLERAIVDSSSDARSRMLQRQLLRSLSLQRHGARALAQTSHVTIDDESSCAVCHLPIARAVFAVYPNGVLAHFKCMQPDRHVCPVSKEDFRITRRYG